MAEGLNKVMLLGNLGADPELKMTQGGQAVLKLRLATTETLPRQEPDAPGADRVALGDALGQARRGAREVPDEGRAHLRRGLAPHVELREERREALQHRDQRHEHHPRRSRQGRGRGRRDGRRRRRWLRAPAAGRRATATRRQPAAPAEPPAPSAPRRPQPTISATTAAAAAGTTKSRSERALRASAPSASTRSCLQKRGLSAKNGAPSYFRRGLQRIP